MNIIDNIISSTSPYRFDTIEYNTPYVKEGSWEEDLKHNVFNHKKNSSVIIHVHGWLESYKSGSNKANYIGKGLDDVGYDGTVIGFLWDSNKLWKSANNKAMDKGEELSEIINRIMEYNPSIDINLCCHSLGSNLTLNCLQSLSDPINNAILMGGSAKHEQIGSGKKFDIKEIKCDNIHNFYYPEDEVLKYGYMLYENGNPIGLSSNPNFENKAFKLDDHGGYYKDKSVFNEIKKIVS